MAAASDVQAKEDLQEPEEKLQRQEAPESDQAGGAIGVPPPEEGTAPTVQPKLAMGAPGDRFEQEADAVAERVVRRMPAGGVRGNGPPPIQAKCTSCEEEDKVRRQPEKGKTSEELQAKSDGLAEGSTAVPDSVQHKLDMGRSGGQPLDPPLRDDMESEFETDFSDVRVHTGTSAEKLNQDLSARAFTYGTDIYFNANEFSPDTEQGRYLLAHELTHVVQQNNDLRRAPKRIEEKPRLGPIVLGPKTGMPKGNLIHNEGLLPTFNATPLNPGLWIEPPVPGANRKDVGPGLSGKPDFYRDNAFDGRPIGINQNKLGGFSRIGPAVAAPQPPATPEGSVEDLAHAPTDIELGDVKPGQSGEEHIGRDQISNYSKGIKNTAKAVRDYQTANGHPGTWDPQPVPMKKLDIPARLAKPNTSGVRFGDLSWWQWIGKWQFWKTTDMKGSCVVYKSDVSGVWAYEWMPVDIPENIGDDAQLKALLERLETKVKPKLHSEKKPAGKMQSSPAARPRAQRQALRRVLRRAPKKHEKFDEKGWQDAYNPWKKDAEKQLGDSTTSKNVGELEALTAAKKRTGIDPGTPQVVKDRAKGAATVKHWMRYGRLYGWLRKTFDRVYVKLAGFAQWIKAKVQKLTKSMGSSGFGNWIKAAALALFKVAKRLGAWAVNMIVDKLLDSLQEGVSNVLKQLAEAATPEAVKSKIEEVEELKAKFEQMLGETSEKLEKALFGDKLELLGKLDEFMKIANTVGTIVSVVKWGIRIVACASPPLIGCLWNLAMAALEYAFSKIMETCWFQAKVLGWVQDSGIKQIIDFPTDVASAIANGANGLIKLPEGIGPLFAEIKANQNEFNIDCSSGGGDGDGGGEGGGGPEPTEEQKALMALAKEVGDDKFEAFLELAAKRAADYGVELTAERIKKLGPLIKSLTVEQMKKLSENQPVDGVPAPVEEFLKNIATLTEAETQRKEARKIDYDKARRSNPKFERDQIKWKPDLFTQSGKPGEIGPPRNPVASDSKEFADAIFDIQKMLGLKADGIAGPSTTKKFYERNNLPKDEAYKNAVELVEAEKRAREEQKAAAERRKEIEALFKDEKVKAAMAAPFPSDAQLKNDLTPLHWENVDDNSAQFIDVKGRAIVGIKTEKGHRLGAYFHYVEKEFKGVKMRMIVKTSRFYALDKIASGEALSYSFAEKDTNLGIGFLLLQAQEKGSFFEMGSFFFGKFVDIP